MADTYKFPKGYDVTVVKKKDIIDCIDENIVDKEVAMAIIDQCELDVANFIRQGRWTGIPFMGSIRIPEDRKLLHSKEQQELISEAYDTLDTEKYILFRKQLSAENAKKVKSQRYFNYITSIQANKHRKEYKKLCNEKGEHYAKLKMFFSANIVAVENEDFDTEW
jgi:hypothetical protein